MLEDTLAGEAVLDAVFSGDFLQDLTVLPQDPTEILVNLAKNNEIDPWHIDIVEVTDKFLERVRELEKLDLRVSGRTLFYASMLLRMKSNILFEPESTGEDEDFFDAGDFFDPEDYPIPDPPMRRKSVRPATLDELIVELKKAEVVERRRRLRLANKGDVRLPGKPDTDTVIGIAHDENIELVVSQLNEQLQKVFVDADCIEFSELLSFNGNDKIMTFLALLFLANRREVWIEQEELFGELTIRKR